MTFRALALRQRDGVTLTLIVVIAVSELIVAMDGHTLVDVVKQ